MSAGGGCVAGGDGARWRVFVSHTSELRQFPLGGSYVAAVERAICACGHVVVDKLGAISVDALPARGTLALFGTPVTVGQLVKADQIGS